MKLLQESPWYQEITRESELRGRREELLSMIKMTLEIKFSNKGLQLIPEIQKISELTTLQSIMRDIISVNTLSDLQIRVRDWGKSE